MSADTFIENAHPMEIPMRNIASVSWLLTAALAVSSLAISAAAQDGEVASLDGLTGSYTLAATAAQRTRREEAIEAVVSEASRLVRRRMRSALTERTEPPRTMRISVRGNAVEFTGSGGTVRLQLGGQAISAEGGRVRALRRRGNLVLVMSGDNGSMTRTFVPSADGRTIVVRTRMTGERLAQPLTYGFTYRRS
ncbi:MAG: hypothetical protein AAF411_04365 [Myxococcota bacterium]